MANVFIFLVFNFVLQIKKIKMKIALITGANKSIGYETVKQLAAQDCMVYLGSRNLENGNKAVEQLKTEGYLNLKAIQIDVTDLNSIVEARNKIEQEAGHLDILINNAGISGSFPQNASNAAIEDFVKHLTPTSLGLLMWSRLFWI